MISPISPSRRATTLPSRNWSGFLLEQVEEERVAGDILKEVRRVQDNLSGMLVLDRELAGRAAGNNQQPVAP